MKYKNKEIFFIIYFFYSLLLVGVLLFFKVSKQCFLFCFVTDIPFITFYMIRELRKKHLICFLFHAFNLEFLVFMIFRIYFADVSENSWRIKYNRQEDCVYALQLILLSMIIMILTQILSANLIGGIGRKRQDGKKGLGLCRNELNIICIVFLIYLSIFFEKFGFGSTRIYTTNRSSSSYEIGLYAIILMMFISFLISVLFFEKEARKSWLYILTLLLYLVEMISIGFKGYRYILVFVAIEFLFLFFDHVKVSMKKIICFCIVGIGFYVLMTYVKYWYIGTTYMGINSVGLHERNIFYSLVALIKELEGTANRSDNTYVNGILLLVPRFISGQFSLASSGNAIIRYFDQGWLGTGMNMGAYYLTEAYMNLRLFGIPAVSVIMAIVIFQLEAIKNRNRFEGKFYYAYVLGQTYNIVYYGFTGYFRILIYYACFLALIGIIHKIYIAMRTGEKIRI